MGGVNRLIRKEFASMLRPGGPPRFPGGSTMERELWPPLYRLVSEVAAAVRQKGVTYQPGVVVAVLLWAALHDRPVAWACDGRHWDTPLRPVSLPSPATMSRRLDDVAVAVVLRGTEDRLRGSRGPDL